MNRVASETTQHTLTDHPPTAPGAAPTRQPTAHRTTAGFLAVRSKAAWANLSTRVTVAARTTVTKATTVEEHPRVL